MADIENSFNIELLKTTNILVYVDEALPDILVVTYNYGKSNIRQFRGVLLDTSKRNLPYGVSSLHPAFSSPTSTTTTTSEDPLHSASQRYLYTDPNIKPTKPIRPAGKCKNSKMTVRLRPRQVLCSKCKGICNENSENVSRKRKSTSEPETSGASAASKAAPVSEKRTYMSTRSTADRNKQLKQQEQAEQLEQQQQLLPSLIPHLTRLLPQDISNALKGNPVKMTNPSCGAKQPLSEVSSSTFDGLTNVEHSKQQQQHSDCNSNVSMVHVDVDSDVEVNRSGMPGETLGKSGKRMDLRKKHGIGSMEDLWDESVFEEAAEKQPFSARTIKISFGSQGEGTVLKIPTKLHLMEDSEENIDTQQNCSDTLKDANTKAARRALKKAKKEARRKVLLNSGSSPPYTSPRGTIGGSSPRYTIGSASPRHGLGTTPGLGSSPLYESHMQPVARRHKHKVKHKKRHREDKRHRSGGSAEESSMKEECLKQKLSINLRRVNESYEPQDCSEGATDPLASPTLVAADDDGDAAADGDDAAEEDEENDDGRQEDEDVEDGQVPNFPPSPILMRITAQALTSALGADGRCLTVGDIVWGKIQGFPWWPGKVLTITNAGVGPQAHIAWYGSTTSSLMQCDQLISFLENFKIRYNKKKRGAYREAIKQASCEAQYLQASRPAIVTAVPPSLASPREIDVIS